MRNFAGHRMAAVTVTFDSERPKAARVNLTVVEDFSAVHAAIDALIADGASGKSDALGAMPFRRAVILPELEQKLGMPKLTWCCNAAADLPPAVADRVARQIPSAGAAESMPLQQFHRYCAVCHSGRDNTPPNFLSGNQVEIEQSIAQCAARIYFRLAMNDLADLKRIKSIMPPARIGRSPDNEQFQADLIAIKNYVAQLLAERGEKLPRLNGGYADLPPCDGRQPKGLPVLRNAATATVH